MHRKKMIAPVVVALLVGGYYLGFAWLVLCGPFVMPGWVRVLFAALPAAFVGVLAFVLKERIDEIRSGEEDDLDNY